MEMDSRLAELDRKGENNMVFQMDHEVCYNKVSDKTVGNLALNMGRKLVNSGVSGKCHKEENSRVSDTGHLVVDSRASDKGCTVVDSMVWGRDRKV